MTTDGVTVLVLKVEEDGRPEEGDDDAVTLLLLEGTLAVTGLTGDVPGGLGEDGGGG